MVDKLPFSSIFVRINGNVTLICVTKLVKVVFVARRINPNRLDESEEVILRCVLLTSE
jgi:ribosomal protein L24E